MNWLVGEETNVGEGEFNSKLPNWSFCPICKSGVLWYATRSSFSDRKQQTRKKEKEGVKKELQQELLLSQRFKKENDS